MWLVLSPLASAAVWSGRPAWRTRSASASRAWKSRLRFAPRRLGKRGPAGALGENDPLASTETLRADQHLRAPARLAVHDGHADLGLDHLAPAAAWALHHRCRLGLA